MKNLLIIFILFISISCSTTVYKLQVKCKTSNKEVFDYVTYLLIEENFMINNSNERLGYLVASTEPKLNIWTGYAEKRVWNIKIYKGNITATAKIVMQKSNMFGSVVASTEIYYNDKVSKEWAWYWNIRNGLSEICENKVIIKKSKLK